MAADIEVSTVWLCFACTLFSGLKSSRKSAVEVLFQPEKLYFGAETQAHNLLFEVRVLPAPPRSPV